MNYRAVCIFSILRSQECQGCQRFLWFNNKGVKNEYKILNFIQSLNSENMKRTILFFSSLLLGFIIYGQKGHQYQIGLELGGYYSPGFTSMKSSSMNADPQLAYSASNYAGSFGGRIGLQYIAKDPAFITFGIAIELGQSPIGMDISKMDLSSGSIGTYSKKLQGNIFQQS
jgi:hypothetical protein